MPESSTASLALRINGQPHTVRPGTTVASAMLLAGHVSRRSVTGEPRAALCGMGICYECRAVVDGIAHRRTCQMACREGMVIETQQ